MRIALTSRVRAGAAAVVGAAALLAGACVWPGRRAAPAAEAAVRPSASMPLELGASTRLVRAHERAAEHGPVTETLVTLRNAGSEPLRLTLTHACTVMVRVFETPARSGRHAWSEGGEVGGCKGMDLPRTVAPGAVDTLRSRVPVGLLLYNGLRPGRLYYFSAYVVIRELPSGHVELPAGAVWLEH